MAKDTHKIRISVLVIIIAILAVLVIVGVFGLKSYVQKSIHDERTIYLDAQTRTTASLIDEMIEGNMEYAGVCAGIVSDDLKPGEDVSSFIDGLQTKLYRDDMRLILVDEKTTWYGEQGTTGKITSTTHYGSETPDEVLYMTTGVDADVESMVYRVRLDEPVQVSTASGPATIGYCSLIYYMDKFREDLKSAFPYECNSFIVDEDGLMIYKEFTISRLVDGTNLFSKFGKVEMLYGDTGEALLEKLRSGEVTVGEFLLNGENYFICTAPLATNNWYVSFVLNADQLASGNYINVLTMYMLLLGGLTSILVIIAALAILLGRNDKLRLESEKKANAMLEEANGMLEEASRAKGIFISNMSHDIRTPINGIMGMTMIAKKENNPPRTRDCLDKIDTSSKYLLSLVNDVLDMSIIENGRLVISEGPIDIGEFIEECRSIVSGQAISKNITLTADYSGVSHRHILADEVHLRQVMINILGNACKFTPQDGHIDITCTEVESEGATSAAASDRSVQKVRLRFEIKDDGIGMSEEFIKNIWTRFSQERNDARTEHKGTGLGMAITKNIVDAMNGEITVASHIGSGSCFKVEIDFKIDESKENVREIPGDGSPGHPQGRFSRTSDAAAASSELTYSAKPATRKLRVLLAEDNEINMEIAKDIIESCGAAVDHAENGAIAVDKFTASAPGTYDIIFMDIMMPVMNGLEACRAIRGSGHADAATVPIIAMTANTLADDIRTARESGMNDYIGKPIIPEQLQSILNKKWVNTS